MSDLIRSYNKNILIANNKGKFEDDNGNEFNRATLELEARFINVKGHEFMRLYNHYVDNESEITIDDVYTLEKNSKVRYRRTTNEGNEGEIWSAKEEIYSYISNEYGYKVAIAMEEYVYMDIERDENNYYYKESQLQFDISRRKERWEVELENCKLMLTKVFQDNTIRYEVEVEMDQLNVLRADDFNTFIDSIHSVFKILYDTECLYTALEKERVIRYVNSIQDISDNREISKSILNEARNLKHKDLVQGGIVGSRYTYNVTDKADGLRCILVVDDIGVWVITPSYKYNLLKRIDWKDREYKAHYIDIVGLICEGEDIPKENRLKNIESTCYIQFFDILSTPDSKVNVRKLTHDKRREHLRHELNVKGTLSKLVEESLLIYGIKSFYVIENINEFFNKVSNVIDTRLDYLTDGLIFTPENEEYNPRTNRENISYDRRILTNYSDICKWKNEITMDLKIGEDRLLYTVRGTENIAFTGSDLKPYNPANYLRQFVQKEGNLKVDLDQLVADTVVEFAYRSGTLVPIRVRYDKTTPNPVFVILDNWKYILDPITEDTITGRSTNLMRKYHNKIKRKLFDYISSEGSPTLLDIASGKGGDVTKWRNFSKIVAVEPNVSNLKDLRARVIGSDMTDRVKIVNTVGQDTQVISEAVMSHIGDKADYCSIMLGFSFFWESEESFNALVQTILQNTKKGIIFLTIDGDAVEQSWYPTFSITKLISPLRIGKDYIDYVKDRVPPIKVNIGHIVNEQDEYLVYIEDLLRYFNQQFLYRADKEEFMNINERKLSSMYSYGYFTVAKNVSLPAVKSDVLITSTPLVEEEEEVIIDKEEVEGGELQTFLEILPEEETIQQLSSPFENPLVRISSLHDESFLDSYLKAFNDKYQDNSDPVYRRKFIKQLRSEIAAKLAKDDYWSKIGEGLLINELTKSLVSKEKVLKYTLANYQSHLIKETGIDIIDIIIITEIIGVDVIILDLYEEGLAYSYTTLLEGKPNKVILLGKTRDDHYDLIGEDSAEGIYTLFDSESDIVKYILNDIQLDKYMPNDIKYYYYYTIISNLDSFDEVNKQGYIMFKEFNRINHSEPYYTHLRKMYNISTKNSFLAINQSKVKIQREALLDRGFTL